MAEESDFQPPEEVAEPVPSLQEIVRTAVREVLQEQQRPIIQQELGEERTRREELEQRLNELIHENQKNRSKAEESDREAVTRAELQRLGVTKVDLAFRAVRNEIHRGEDGGLVAKTATGEMNLREYLKQFLDENPELLPARIPGGSGMSSGGRRSTQVTRVDLDRIGPGMSADELERARREIVRVASETFRGL